jgi:capsular polysaccharide biosynthesis protein
MWNYSLFLFEVAPTIMLSSFLPGLEQVRVRLFFQQFMRAEDINNRLAVFKLFGVERDRMLIADADLYRHKGVIIFKINDAHRSQRLSRMVSPVCAAIREEYASSQITTPRKVYISRQRASARAVSNYDELKRSILERRGFVPVELESLTLAQQVDMFAKADVVLAEHGAGLANIAFMRPGAYVIEAFPEPIASRAVYRYLAAHCRLNYLCCSFATQAGWRWDQDNVEVPIDAYEYLASKV